MGVLALLVILFTQLLNSAATIMNFGNKRMDADSQARQLLDRMAIDFAQMLKRTDVSYFVKTTGNTQPGNDQIAFYSAVPGYNPERIHPSCPVAAKPGLACRLSGKLNAEFPSYNKLERLGKGLFGTPPPQPIHQWFSCR